MSRALQATPQPDNGFPRVSGDEPQPATVCTVVWMFSPRERG